MLSLPGHFVPNPVQVHYRTKPGAMRRRPLSIHTSYDLKRNLPLRGGADSVVGRLHRALAEIRSAEDAAVLQAAATLTLYSLRGEKP